MQTSALRVDANGVPWRFQYRGRPRIDLLEEGDRYALAAPWWFAWRGDDGHAVERVIQVGFLTDFASIPRIYRWRFSPTGKQGYGALAHDFLYREAIEPRAVCDRVFRDGMEALKVNVWDRNVMYRAVRAFGWRAYGRPLKIGVTEA